METTSKNSTILPVLLPFVCVFFVILPDSVSNLYLAPNYIFVSCEALSFFKSAIQFILFTYFDRKYTIF